MARFRPKEVGYRCINYELMVIMDPSIDERTVAPTLDKFLTVITAAGGTLDKDRHLGPDVA